MIEVKGLKHAYETGDGTRKAALNGINFIVRPGETVALIGANGSGKTTLARHLNGLLKPHAGQVLVDGLDTLDVTAIADIRQKVGYLFQDPDNQLVAPTVAEDVAFGPENLGLPSDEIITRVHEALDMVGMLELSEKPLQFLSGGQKQCVALAGVLAMQPRYLVLDEPTSMLDPSGREMVRKAIVKLKSQGYAIIYITHHLEEALAMDRIILLEEGKVAMDGQRSDILPLLVEGCSSLELPPLLALMKGLRQYGLDVPGDIYTVDGLVDYLCS